MKIYFNANLLGKLEGLENNYKIIYDTINKLGHTNLSDLVVKTPPLELLKDTDQEAAGRFKEIVRNIKEADIVVQEMSFPSLGTGYISALAVQLGKPLIALHLPKKDLYLLRGVESDKIVLVEYTLETLQQVLKEAINFASDSMDTRFNFFVPPAISNYLDWITKHKKLPRAVFLRELIEEHMHKNKEYNSEI